MEKTDNRYVVFKKECDSCSSVYIGQTSQLLKNRQAQHQNNVKNRDKKSALANHVINTGHKINLNNITILDIEPHKKIREFSEMLNIHTHQNTLNRTEDTQMLKNIYKSFLNNIQTYKTLSSFQKKIFFFKIRHPKILLSTSFPLFPFFLLLLIFTLRIILNINSKILTHEKIFRQSLLITQTIINPHIVQ